MELYEHPINKFVAGFIGSPQMNFYDVRLEKGCMVFAGGETIRLADSVLGKLQGCEVVTMGIRGEDIKLDASNLETYGESKQKAVVENAEIMGNENNLYFEFGGLVSVARVPKYDVSQIGDEINFVFLPDKMHFFDTETGKSITEASGKA